MVDTLITLYNDNEIEFDTHGLGALSEATECIVTEERNGAFELSMKYPVTGMHYDDLILRRIIFAKPNPYDAPQPFRIYNITRPIDGIVTVEAQHLTYDLVGYPIAPFSVNDSDAAFIELNQQMNATWNEGHHPFSFHTDIPITLKEMGTATPTNARSILGGSEGTILDIYGGEYSWDRWTVFLHKERGKDRGVSIVYGKNLTNLEQEENCENVWTGIYPYWYSDDEETGGLVQLTEKIVPAEGEFDHERIQIVDLTSEFEDMPSESELRVKARDWMTENEIGKPKVSLDVSFVNLSETDEFKDQYHFLQEVRLCDTVRVSFPKLGVESSAKCIATEYNVLTGKYNSIQLGEAKSSLSSTISDTPDTVRDEIDKDKTDLQRAIENATKLITGGLGGYVVLHASDGGKIPDEILVMDAPTIEDAVNIWRWNKNGLGFSSSGYEGPFGLAMTMDGAIVASYVTAGELNGQIIKAGTILSTALLVDYTDSTSKVSPSGVSRPLQRTALLALMDAIDFNTLAQKCGEDGEITDVEASLMASTYNSFYSRVNTDMANAAEIIWGSELFPEDLKYTTDAQYNNVNAGAKDLINSMAKVIKWDPRDFRPLPDATRQLYLYFEKLSKKISKATKPNLIDEEKEQLRKFKSEVSSVVSSIRSDCVSLAKDKGKDKEGKDLNTVDEATRKKLQALCNDGETEQTRGTFDNAYNKWIDAMEAVVDLTEKKAQEQKKTYNTYVNELLADYKKKYETYWQQMMLLRDVYIEADKQDTADDPTLKDLVADVGKKYDIYKKRTDALQETLDNVNRQSVIDETNKALADAMAGAKKELTDLGLAAAQADGTLRAIVSDNIISAAERRSISKLLDVLKKEKDEVDNSVENVMDELYDLIYRQSRTELTTQYNGCQSRWNAHTSAYNTLASAIQAILDLTPEKAQEDDPETPYEDQLQSLVNAYNRAYSTYQTAYTDLMSYLEIAQGSASSAKLEVTKNSISLSVSQTTAGLSDEIASVRSKANSNGESIGGLYDVIGGLDGRMTRAEASIKVNATAIENRVTRNDVASVVTQNWKNVIMSFNNNATNIYFGATGIMLYARANSSTEANTAGTKVPTESGYGGTQLNTTTYMPKIHMSHTGIQVYHNGYSVGYFRTSRTVAEWGNHRGMSMDLDEGEFLAWTIKDPSQSEDLGFGYYKTLFYYAKQGIWGRPRTGLYANCDITIQQGCKLYYGDTPVTASLLSDYQVIQNADIPVVTNIDVTEDGELVWDTSMIKVREGRVTAVPTTKEEV